MEVLPIAPLAPLASPPVHAALMFTVTPAANTPMTPFSVESFMSVLADSQSVAPAPDPSFQCIMRASLRFDVDRPDWIGLDNRGFVVPSCVVARGSVTRSTNG